MRPTGQIVTAIPVTLGVNAGAIVVGVEGAGLRRRLGPVAWCALEAVVGRSDDRNVAAVSVRSLAVELGVSKNTAQRALAGLRHAGLVEPISSRRDGGRFSIGGYRVTVAASVLARVPANVGASTTVVVEAPTRSRRGRPVRVRPVVVEQLSLLPEV